MIQKTHCNNKSLHRISLQDLWEKKPKIRTFDIFFHLICRVKFDILKSTSAFPATNKTFPSPINYIGMLNKQQGDLDQDNCIYD